jgi:hypothetical protein
MILHLVRGSMLASEAQVKQRVHHFIEISPPEKKTKMVHLVRSHFLTIFVTTYTITSK